MRDRFRYDNYLSVSGRSYLAEVICKEHPRKEETSDGRGAGVGEQVSNSRQGGA